MKKYYFISRLNSNPVRRNAKGNITWGVSGLMRRHNETIKFDSLLEAHAFRLENLDRDKNYAQPLLEDLSASVWEVCEGKVNLADDPCIEIQGVKMRLFDLLAHIHQEIKTRDRR